LRRRRRRRSKRRGEGRREAMRCLSSLPNNNSGDL